MKKHSRYVNVIKRGVKNLLWRCRKNFIDSFYSFNSDDLRNALRDLGVEQGDLLLVHSSYDAFEGFTGKPRDVIETLEALVGPEGTIMMPSLPFGGTAIDYVRGEKITDIARTPSRMGLLTEVFRRQKGTMRSLHPTHPVVARGAKANQMISRHQDARTPCGKHSPFAELLEAKGKNLLLGVDIEAMTYFHFLEELFEPRMGRSPFTEEIFEVEVRNGSETATVQTRLFDPTLSRARNVSAMLPALRKLPGYKNGKVGNLPFLLISAAAARDAFQSTLETGASFYEQ